MGTRLGPMSEGFACGVTSVPLCYNSRMYLPPSIRRALEGVCAPFMRLPLGTRLALAALAACCTFHGGGKGAGARAPRADAAGCVPPVCVDADAVAGGPRSRAAAAVAEEAITEADIARGWRVVSEAPSGPLDEPPGAVTNRPLRLRGGSAWAFRVAPPGWRFPWAGGALAGVTVLARGEVRPDARTRFFPVPLPGGVSLLPEARWGFLPDGGASVLRRAVTPDGTLLLDWRNALAGRDPNRPTDLRMALHADGSFAWYADGRVTRYAPVLPFDWDGDGLANPVDPDPRVPHSADAHGANAEWYRVACSNVFEAVGDRTQQVVSLPNSETVAFRADANARAYYFVDVVAAAGPAPVTFSADRDSRLGSPVLVARAGETNRVPLLVGVAYAVTSTVPVAVSAAAPGGFAEIADAMNCVPPPGGLQLAAVGTHAYTVRWPLKFEVSREGRTSTFRAVPYDPGGTFEWTSGADGHAGARRASRSGGCSFTAGGGTVAFDCPGGCGCGGCSVAGTYRLEGALFQLPPATCGCGDGDDDDDDPPGSEPPPAGPSTGGVSVSFSAKAVVFEDRHETAPGAWAERRSTRTVLTVRADGGPDGGTFTLTPRNLGKLAPEGGTGPLSLPSGGTLAPGETYSATFECSGVEASGAEGDVAVSASFTGAGTGETQGDEAKLTVVQLEFEPVTTLGSVNRHFVGIREESIIRWTPGTMKMSFTPPDDGYLSTHSGYALYQAPLERSESGISIRCNDTSFILDVSVVEPAEVIACGRPIQNTFGLGHNVAGGIGMGLELYVMPTNVAFSGIAVQEVPTDYRDPRGYFANPYFGNVWSHTVERHAGEWHNIAVSNFFMADNADMGEMLPRMKPDGTITDDLRYGWMNGTMNWKIPVGWNERNSAKGETVVKSFQTYWQQFAINAQGTLRIAKLGNWIQRGTNNIVQVNGGVR